VVILPKSRVLRSMPPLQPLGQERHRRPVSELTRLPLKPRMLDEPPARVEESTVAQ
jgi:hypothetical protein